MKKFLSSWFGLGDLAYYAFRPVVYFIDWVWATDLKHCDVCKGRRAKWNEYSVPVSLILLILAFFAIAPFVS